MTKYCTEKQPHPRACPRRGKDERLPQTVLTAAEAQPTLATKKYKWEDTEDLGTSLFVKGDVQHHNILTTTLPELFSSEETETDSCLQWETL